MFDPDSEEFFLDAEYEAFLLDEDNRNQAQDEQTQADTEILVAPVTHSEDVVRPSATSNTLRWSNNTRVYRLSDASPQGNQVQVSNEGILQDRANISGVLSTTELETDNTQLERPPSLTMPIDIPRTSTPSSGSDSSAPPTPPQAFSFGSLGTPHSAGIYGDMSPPPSFSPRLYTWGSRMRNSGSPGSASIGRSPLTNPSARASFPRIISASPALRV